MNQQAPILHAMRQPGFYPPPAGVPEHVETHISHVFLTPDAVYKLKKAVVFPFLDFSSLTQRRRACEEEVRLNRRLAPGVYLGVLPITSGADERPRLGGAGRVLDYVVWMRRLPAETMLDDRVQCGTVDADTMGALARLLATFHADAPTGAAIEAHGDPEMLVARWIETTRGLAALVPDALSLASQRFLEQFGPFWIERHRALLQQRQQEGRIREGHGDLKAEHVCVLDPPVPAAGRLPPLGPGIVAIDCLEFSRALRCNDVAADVAFLTIDLDAANRRDLSRALVDAYVALTGDGTFRAILPFYECARATVRGLVDGLKARAEGGEGLPALHRASAWLRRAVQYAWRAQGPCVVACCGRSGTGKSTVAAQLAASTGFVHLSSDEVRKRNLGIPADQPAPGTAYAPTARASVYQTLNDAARTALESGRGVIVDATFLRRADRARFLALTAETGTPLLFIECSVPSDVVRQRLLARAPGASDATWDVYVQQAAEQEPFGADEHHLVLPTSADPAALGDSALEALWQWYRTQPPGAADATPHPRATYATTRSR